MCILFRIRKIPIAHHHGRFQKKRVGVARFELTISWSQTKRDTGLRYTPSKEENNLIFNFKFSVLPDAGTKKQEFLKIPCNYIVFLEIKAFHESLLENQSFCIWHL